MNENIMVILNKYMKYVTNYLTPNSIVVFDGYEKRGTKFAKCLHRQNNSIRRKIRLTDVTNLSVVSKEF